MYHERTACDIIMSCIVLHNYCRDLEYSVKDVVKEMLRKESELTLTRKHQENTSKKEGRCPIYREILHYL